MAPTEIAASDEVAFEFMPFFRGYKDGHAERYLLNDRVPTSLSPDAQTGVSTKDVEILSKTGELNFSARLFLPREQRKQKLPLLIYFHGGAFCFGSPFCGMYHHYVSSLVSKANVLALSVDYRLAPENPIPAAYQDAWATVEWVAQHTTRRGPESWLNDYVDFERVFVAGDSAGANITHNTVLRAGAEKLSPGLKLFGASVVHPDFVGEVGSLNKAWLYTCPDSPGEDDPRINPSKDPKLSSLGCKKMLVCIAEKDDFQDAGRIYHDAIKESGWGGEVELFESKGEGHVFHLFNPAGENSIVFLEKIACFLSQEF